MSHSSTYAQPAEPSAAAAPEMTKSELQVRANALHHVQHALRCFEHGGASPRQQQALGAAAAVAVLGALVLPYALSRWLGMSAQVFIALVLAGGAYLACMSRSNALSTWAEALDKRLAEYTPFNREAFLGMQRELQDVGYLEKSVVRAWLDGEMARHAALARRLDGPQARKFLARVL